MTATRVDPVPPTAPLNAYVAPGVVPVATVSADEWARVSAITHYGVLAGPAPDELYDLARVAALICGTTSASVNIVDDVEQRPIASSGPAVRCAREDSLCHTAVDENTALIVEDASLDPRFAHHPQVDGRLGTIRRYASALLRTPTGLPLGTLCVYDSTPGPFGAEQIDALEALGRQAMETIHQRRRADDLDRAMIELSRAHEHMAAFAGQISHDLKTPLTAALGFTQLALESASVLADPATGAFLKRAESSSQRMLAMIDNVLRYARVGGTLRRETIELDDLVAEVAQDLSPMIDAAGDAQIVTDGSSLVGDRQQVHTLLQNLIANAVRYREPSRPSLVRVSSAALADGWVLRVEDNGLGIPADRRDDVLVPLTRLHPQLPGSGLGLATCDRIAHAHGGTLHLDDTPGGGTTVRVVLHDPHRAATTAD